MHHSPLDGLPDELILLIVDQLVPGPEQIRHDECLGVNLPHPSRPPAGPFSSNDLEALKGLRLACRRFGDMPGMKAILFHSFRESCWHGDAGTWTCRVLTPRL